MSNGRTSMSWQGVQRIGSLTTNSQWEQDKNSKDAMLSYLISLLDDSNDFSCPAAKACHAVLCWMEQGEIKDYTQVYSIDGSDVCMQILLTKSPAVKDCL